MSTSDYTPLIRRVGQIFSKHENLAVSFVTVRAFVPRLVGSLVQGPPSMLSPGVDIQGINQCYELLLNLVRYC